MRNDELASGVYQRRHQVHVRKSLEQALIDTALEYTLSDSNSGGCDGEAPHCLHCLANEYITA